MWTWFHKLASPPHVYRIAGLLVPWFGWVGGVLSAVGVVWGLRFAPADYQQGDGFRILYVHAPSAWMSMFTYVVMALAAGIGLIWRMKVAHAVAASCAPIGAAFTASALVTGALWGQRMWGTWWVWDARLTSELILLFLYFGYIALRSAYDDQQRADRASAILALVGVVNIPIIHYSVVWWNTLHQAASVTKLARPSIAPEMLIPLILMFFGFNIVFGAVLLTRLRGEVLLRERNADWIRALVAQP